MSVEIPEDVMPTIYIVATEVPSLVLRSSKSHLNVAFLFLYKKVVDWRLLSIS